MTPKEKAKHLLQVCKDNTTENEAKKIAEMIILHSMMESLAYYGDEERANHWVSTNRELEKL